MIMRWEELYYLQFQDLRSDNTNALDMEDEIFSDNVSFMSSDATDHGRKKK